MFDVARFPAFISAFDIILSILSKHLFQPELDVMVSVNEPLVDDSQMSMGNLVTITVESLYSTPDAWSTSGTQYAYATALPLPINAEVSPSSGYV